MTAILHFINKWGHSCQPSDNRWGGFWRLSWRRFPSLSLSEGPEGKRAGEKAKAAEWAPGLHSNAWSTWVLFCKLLRGKALLAVCLLCYQLMELSS